MEAMRRKASAFRLKFSQSLANLRQRPSQEKVRSTTQRRGKTSKPFAASERLTISVSKPGKAFFCAARKMVLISAIGEKLLQKREPSEQCAQNENTAVAILNVGGMNDRMKQQAYRVDENMPLLAVDLFARIIAVRINAAPPFSAGLSGILCVGP